MKKNETDSEPVQVDEEFIRRKADELMCDVDSGDEIANHEFLHDFAKQLLAQKRTVTREFILRWTKFINKAPTGSMMQSEYIVREILKELGMKTIEK